MGAGDVAAARGAETDVGAGVSDFLALGSRALQRRFNRASRDGEAVRVTFSSSMIYVLLI